MSNILECSSKGDKRFSAFCAKVKLLGEEKSIEKWYQESKGFNNERVIDYKRNKGRCPDYFHLKLLNEKVKLDASYISSWYKFLWIMYFAYNKKSRFFEYILRFDDYHDMFKDKNTVNCQADTIRELAKNGLYKSLISINDFIDKVFIQNGYSLKVVYDDAKNIDRRNKLYKGHVLLTSLNDIRNVALDNYNVKLFIVRSPGKVMNNLKDYGFIHVPQLSPSLSLFTKYNSRWKEGNFTLKERDYMKKGNTHTWWDLYMCVFKYEMLHRKDLQVALKRLRRRLDAGDDILLTCFCKNFARCHRALIGYYLQGLGYDVRFYLKQGEDMK